MRAGQLAARLGVAACLGMLVTPPSAARAQGTVEGSVRIRFENRASLSVDLYGKYNAPDDSVIPPPPHRAVIALHPVHGPVPAPSGEEPIMDQRNLAFDPRILVVQTGSSVRFLNSDSYFHNAFSLSPAKKFDVGRYPKGEYERVTFDRTGVIHVFCDIHAEMQAYVVAVDTPWFTLSEPDGTWKLTGIPSGEYRVEVWHEGLPRLQEAGSTTVESGRVTRLELDPRGDASR